MYNLWLNIPLLGGYSIQISGFKDYMYSNLC